MRAALRSVALALCVATLALPVWAGTRLVVHKRVVCTATAADVVPATPNRNRVTLMNEGTITVYLGGTHAGAAILRPLHAGASLEYVDFQAGLQCNTAGDVSGTGQTTVAVEEEMK